MRNSVDLPQPDWADDDNKLTVVNLRVDAVNHLVGGFATCRSV
jgi:hypothetical protein